jgi:hypothetical protein
VRSKSSNYGVFTPEVCRAMGDAFDKVCDELRTRKAPPFDPYEIAQRIIALAKRGETGAARMVERVLGPKMKTLH